MKHIQTRVVPIAAAILSGLVTIGFLAGFFGWREYYDRKRSNFREKTELYIYPNMNVRDVLDIFMEKDVVKNSGSLKRSFRREGLMAKGGRPGEARIVPGHFQQICREDAEERMAKSCKAGALRINAAEARHRRKDQQADADGHDGGTGRIEGLCAPRRIRLHGG